MRTQIFKGLLVACILGLTGTSSLALAEDVRMFIRHSVADYGAWKKGYDSYAPTQKKMGVFFQAVYQSTNNPNDVTVIHDFHNVEKAKAFAASPDLKTTMGKLGVTGEPQIWYVIKGKSAK